MKKRSKQKKKTKKKDKKSCQVFLRATCCKAEKEDVGSKHVGFQFPFFLPHVLQEGRCRSGRDTWGAGQKWEWKVAAAIV